MLAWLLLSVVASAAEPPPAPAPPRNVLVLTVDALRPDRMAVYGYDRPTTPYLDRFASESFVFERAFATGAWTSPGIASIFTGLHPPAHGQNSRYDYVDHTLLTPLDALRAQRGVRGIARDIEQATIRGLGFTVAYTPAIQGDLETAQWLAKQPDGWVAWIHVKPTHLPYAPSPFNLRRFGGDRLDSPALTAIRTHGTVYPRDYGLSWRPPVIASFTAEEQAVVSDLYDGAVADADELVGRMLEALRAAGKLDTTLVILSADHGEELFDHGWVGHASTGYEGKVYDPLIRVPLIVRAPGGAAVGRSAALVSHIDVMPTVFELMGADPSTVDGGMQGRSLVPLMRGQGEGHDVVYARTTFKGWTCPYDETRDGLTAARATDRKLIRVRAGGEIRHEAYDLAADPRETSDLYATDPGRFADLASALDAYDRSSAERALALMFTAGERRLAALGEAARARDAVAAAQAWLALVELERTYGNEWLGPLDLPGQRARWIRLRREAERLRDQASR
jgi:choline-sulfatase